MSCCTEDQPTELTSPERLADYERYVKEVEEMIHDLVASSLTAKTKGRLDEFLVGHRYTVERHVARWILHGVEQGWKAPE